MNRLATGVFLFALGMAHDVTGQCNVGSPNQFVPPNGRSSWGPNGKFEAGYATSFDLFTLQGAHKLVLKENYGYTIFDLSNPTVPASPQYCDIESHYPRTGDTFYTVAAVSAAPDGSRLVVGYRQPHSNLLMVPQGGSPGCPYNFGGEFYQSRAGDDFVIQRGSRYIGFGTIQGSSPGVSLADVTTPLSGTAAQQPGSIPNEYVYGTSGARASTGFVAGRYVVYAGSSEFVVMETSDPGPVGNVSSGFRVFTFDAADVGLPAGDSIQAVAGAIHPVSGKLTMIVTGGQSSFPYAADGYVLVAMDSTGTITRLGARFVPPSPWTSNGMSTAVASGSDVIFFAWTRKSDAAEQKLLTLTAGTWPVDQSPNAEFPYLGQSWGMKALQTGSNQWALYTVAYSKAFAQSVGCTTTPTSPATADITAAVVDPSSGAATAIASGSTVFLGDTVRLTPSVTPATALQDWRFDLDYHAASESSGSAYPRLRNPDLFSTTAATTPSAFNMVGPCDPTVSGTAWATGAGCWASVRNNAATGGPDFASATPAAGTAKTLSFAFEAQNANGSANLEVFDLVWKVPAVRLASASILPGAALVDTSEGHPTTYRWYFGSNPAAPPGEALGLDSTCTGRTCPHAFPGAGRYNYWLTVGYAGGYQSPDYSCTGACPTMGAIAVTNVQPAVTILANGYPCADDAQPSCSARIGDHLQAVSQVNGTLDASPPYDLTWTVSPTTGVTPSGAGPLNPFVFSISRTGTYTLTMSGYGGYSATRTIDVTSAAALTASASATPAVGAVNTPIVFSAAASGGSPPYGYSWSFGDGQSATQQNPTHAYASAGGYTARLTVTDSANAVTTVQTAVTITSGTGGGGTGGGGGTLTVNASAAPSSAEVYVPIQFSATASGGAGGYAYTWQFGDGSVAQGALVQHGYAAAGTYVATATALDASGNAGSGLVPVVITSGTEPLLTGDYGYRYADGSNVNIAAVPAGKAITFTGLDAADTYSWDFGDGSPAASSSPATHAYAAGGDFTVRLTVSRSGQPVTTTSHPTVFHVLPPPEPPYWVVPGMVANDAWQSDLTIYNPGEGATTLTLFFLDSVAPVEPAQLEPHRIVLENGSSRSWANVLPELFGAPKGHWGAILVRGEVASASPIFTARTYSTGASGGTFGLSVPASATSSGVKPQASTATTRLIGLKENERAYTNLGVVNLKSDPVVVEARFFDASGASLGGPVTFSLGGYGVFQLAHVLSAAPPAGAGYTEPADTFSAAIRVVSGTAVYPYATVIDTVSKDPIVVTPRLDASNTYRMPGIVRVQGANGTVWRSDVVLYNASSARRTLDLTYSYATPGTGPASQSVPVTIEPAQSLEMADFVRTMLHLPDEDTGAYANSWVDVGPAPETDGTTNTDPVLVLGKTYNDQPTGRVGLQVPGYTADDGASSSGAKRRLLVAGATSSFRYRTNLAFFLLPGASAPSVTATVNVLDAAGTLLKQAPIQLDAVTGFTQLNDGALFGDIPAEKRAQMSVIVDQVTGNAAIAGYATIVDNISGDGTFVQAVPAP